MAMGSPMVQRRQVSIGTRGAHGNLSLQVFEPQPFLLIRWQRRNTGGCICKNLFHPLVVRVRGYAAGVTGTRNGVAFNRVGQVIFDFGTKFLHRAEAGHFPSLLIKLEEFRSALVEHESPARWDLECTCRRLVDLNASGP